jgi:predicted nucleic acid-binding protein
VAWNPERDSLEFTEASDEVRAADRAAGEFMADEARSLRIHYRRDLLTFKDFDNLVAGGWAGAFDLARELGLAIFSDDHMLRAIARSEGLSTFGTLAVIDVLVERGALSPEDALEARIELRKAKAVELPFNPAEFESAVAQQGYKCVGAALGVARPTFWLGREQALASYRRVLKSAPTPRDAAEWLGAGLHGVTALVQGAEAQEELVAIFLVESLQVAGRSGDGSQLCLQSARAVAVERGLKDPLLPGFRKLMEGLREAGAAPDVVAAATVSLAAGLPPEDREMVVRLVLGIA